MIFMKTINLYILKFIYIFKDLSYSRIWSIK